MTHKQIIATNTQKVVLITGGAQRIGAAIARSFHAAGYRIIIHHRHSQKDAKSLCHALNSLRPHSAQHICADLSVVNSTNDLHNFCQSTLALFGRLDTLVHNASSFYPTNVTGTDDLRDAWEDLMLTNAKAPLLLSQAFYPKLSSDDGNIISLLDIHAQGRPFVGHCIYTMAKAAHLAMVQALALEFSPKVRINGIAPGINILPAATNPYLTGQALTSLIDSVPLARIGTPEDVAQAALFLAEAPYITGQILAVDGGRSLTLKGG